MLVCHFSSRRVAHAVGLSRDCSNPSIAKATARARGIFRPFLGPSFLRPFQRAAHGFAGFSERLGEAARFE